jgi:hypothetical protein
MMRVLPQGPGCQNPRNRGSDAVLRESTVSTNEAASTLLSLRYTPASQDGSPAASPLGTPEQGCKAPIADLSPRNGGGEKSPPKSPDDLPKTETESKQRFRIIRHKLYNLIVEDPEKEISNQATLEYAQELIEKFKTEISNATDSKPDFQWHVFAHSLLISSCSMVAGYCIFYMNILPMTPLYLALFSLLLCTQLYDQMLQWWDKSPDPDLNTPNSSIDQFSGCVSIMMATCVVIIAIGGIGYSLCLWGGFGLYTLQGGLCFLLPLVLLTPHLKSQGGRFIKCCKGEYYQGFSTRIDTDNLGRTLGYVKALIVVFRTIIAFVVLDNGLWLTWGWLSWPALIGFSVLSMTQLWESYLYTNMWYSPTVDNEQKDFGLTHLVSSLHDLLDEKARQEKGVKPNIEKESFKRGWLANIVGLAGTILVIFVPIIVGPSNWMWFIGGIMICGLDLFQRVISADYLYGDSESLKILNWLGGEELDRIRKVPLSAFDIFRGLSYLVLMISNAISSLWAGKNRFYTLFLGFLPLIFPNINIVYYSMWLSVVFVLISLTSNFLNQHKSMKQYLQSLRVDHCLLKAGRARKLNNFTVLEMRTRGYSDKQLKVLGYLSKEIDRKEIDRKKIDRKEIDQLEPDKKMRAQFKELTWWCNQTESEESEESESSSSLDGLEDLGVNVASEGLDAVRLVEQTNKDPMWEIRAEKVIALLNRSLREYRPYLSSKTMQKPYHRKWWFAAFSVGISIITREVSHFAVALLFLNMIPVLTPFPHLIYALATIFVLLDVVGFYYNAQKSLRHYDICLKIEELMKKVTIQPSAINRNSAIAFECNIRPAIIPRPTALLMSDDKWDRRSPTLGD